MSVVELIVLPVPDFRVYCGKCFTCYTIDGEELNVTLKEDKAIGNTKVTCDCGVILDINVEMKP